MALKIRLARGGAKKRPFYHIVIADARSPRDGRFVEKVGTYNPMLPQDSKERITLNVERIKYWLSVGALPTDRVALFLGNEKLVPMPVQTVTPKKSAPKAKAQERVASTAAAAAAAATASASATGAEAAGMIKDQEDSQSIRNEATEDVVDVEAEEEERARKAAELVEESHVQTGEAHERASKIIEMNEDAVEAAEADVAIVEALEEESNVIPDTESPTIPTEDA
jgi:small subunit ribosomal protein S16